MLPILRFEDPLASESKSPSLVVAWPTVIKLRLLEFVSILSSAITCHSLKYLKCYWGVTSLIGRCDLGQNGVRNCTAAKVRIGTEDKTPRSRSVLSPKLCKIYKLHAK